MEMAGMTETLSYPAELTVTVEGVSVAFPDFPEVVAWGADEGEALAKGAEVLRAALWDALNDGMILPIPSPPGERPVVSIVI
jgi:predicted RNase H-like HicB family nuclease